MTRYATIVATGRYVPEIEVTNDMLRERFKHIPDFVDKMEASSGIKTRWHAPKTGLPYDNAGLRPESFIRKPAGDLHGGRIGKPDYANRIGHIQTRGSHSRHGSVG
jgi:hypothetical protein